MLLVRSHAEMQPLTEILDRFNLTRSDAQENVRRIETGFFVPTLLYQSEMKNLRTTKM
jgi:hypothetical protein